MTTLREAAQQALEEQEQAEPVAWMVYTLDGKSVCVTDNPADFAEGHRALPLYTRLPRREWVSLTEEEIVEIVAECAASAHRWDDISVARAIEQALKEKNQ